MLKETRHDVTIDCCSSCEGIWFDLEEIHAYAKTLHPPVSYAPSDEDFSKHTAGMKELCTCCEKSALELGELRGVTFRRCTWCGGIFLGMNDLRKITQSPEAGDSSARVGEDAVLVGIAEVFGILVEIVGEAL
jgi:Zn-finger nucleic acid-binding protein